MVMKKKVRVKGSHTPGWWSERHGAPKKYGWAWKKNSSWVEIFDPTLKEWTVFTRKTIKQPRRSQRSSVRIFDERGWEVKEGPLSQ